MGAAGAAAADAEVHKVLADLYGRLNAGASLPEDVPAPSTIPAPAESAPALIADSAPLDEPAPVEPAPAEA